MLLASLAILMHLRREGSIADRKLHAHQPGIQDRRGFGDYVLPSNDTKRERRYDAHGNEVRAVEYDK